MTSFFQELKRRNVLRVSLAYVAGSWLLIQVAETILPLFDFADSAARLVVIVLAIGFIPVVLFAWIFELTPEGLKKEEDVDRAQSITVQTGKKLNRVIIVVLGLALTYFLLDRMVLAPEREAEKLKQARQEGVEQALAQNRQESEKEKSIAVLPFVNRSMAKEDEHFTEGMHDELLTRLARIATLRVTSRTSVMRYRDTEKSIPEIADELSVATILEGGVQRQLDQVRINVQLIDARTDEHLWAEIYDRELTADSLFAIQSEISQAIAAALHAALTPSEKLGLERVPTENLAAYNAYLAGRAIVSSYSVADMTEAARHFDTATGLDPDFADAWAALCETKLQLYRITSEREYFDAAETNCNQALTLDDSRAEVHVAMAMLYSQRGQHLQAEVSLQRANQSKTEAALENALEFGQLTMSAELQLGLVLARQNRLDEAEEKSLRAVQTDPTNWEAQSTLGYFYTHHSDKQDHYELAVPHVARAAALRPDIAFLWNNLGTTHYMLGHYDQAVDAWQQSLAIEPNRTAYTNSGLALLNSRKFEEAVRMQELAVEYAPDDHRAMGRLGDALRFVDGESQRAVEVYTQAADLARQKLEVNERDWQTLGLLSSYLTNSGEYEEASIVSQKALQLAKRNADSLYQAALVANYQNQIDACLALLEEAISKDPSLVNLMAIDPDLENLSGLPRFQDIIASQ